MTRTILVTGGAGFIGSHLVDALIYKGYKVRVYDNLEIQVHGPLREQNRWPDYSNQEAEYICGDVRDRDKLTKAMEGIEVIFHLAAAVGVGQSMYEIDRYTDTNVRGTSALLDIIANESSIKKRLEKLIVASSMSIYGEGKYECPVHGVVYPTVRPISQLVEKDWEMRCPVGGKVNSCSLPLKPLPTDEEKRLVPTSVYASNKRSQEELCLSIGMAYEIPTVALRFFNTYGKRQSITNPYTGIITIFSSQIMNSKSPRIFEDGLQIRDFIHVSDVVKANLLAMESSKADYTSLNVGSGNPIKVNDVAEILLEKLGSNLKPDILNQYRNGDIRHCFADTSKIRALGFSSQIGFLAGISDFIDWLKSQQSIDRTREATLELRKHSLIR